MPQAIIKGCFNRNGLAAAISTAIAFGSGSVVAEDKGAEATEKQTEIMEQVVVTGSRFEQELGDVAGSIAVMDAEDIESQGVANMADLFRYEPGVEVTGSSGTAQNFIIRGMGADRVMMVKDGMRMNEGYGADGANDQVGRGFIDVDTIKQVEVAKGASSSLFGADALGGVVAFSTKDPEDYLQSDNSYLKVHTGTDGRQSEVSAGAIGALRLGQSLSAMLSVNQRDGENTQNYSESRELVEVQGRSILLKTSYMFDHHKTLSFTLDRYEQTLDRPDNGGPHGNYQGLTMGGDWTIHTQFSTSEQENSSYTLRYEEANSTLALYDGLTLTAYRSETEQRDLTFINHDALNMGTFMMESRDKSNRDAFLQDTVGASVAAFKELGAGSISHVLSYGFDWDTSNSQRPRSELRVQAGATILDTSSAPFPENDTERLGLYIQDQVDFGNGWQLVPGLRFDRYSMDPVSNDELYSVESGGAVVDSISDSHISPKLGLIYDLSANVSGYFQYSTGFKVPPYDLAYFTLDHVSFAGVGIRNIPADELEPEESQNFEIGVRGDSGDLQFNASLYHNEFTNFIEVAYVETVDEVNMDFGFPLPIAVDIFQYQNIDEVAIDGMEFSLNYQLSETLATFINGGYMEGENQLSGEPITTLSPVSGTIGLNYQGQGWNATLATRWAGRMDDVPDGARTTAGYASVDAMINWDLTEHFKLRAQIYNLGDKEYTRYSSVAGIPDDGREFDLYTQPGRAASLRLDYTL